MLSSRRKGLLAARSAGQLTLLRNDLSRIRRPLKAIKTNILYIYGPVTLEMLYLEKRTAGHALHADES